MRTAAEAREHIGELQHEAQQYRQQARELAGDIDEARQTIMAAERLQWQVAGYATRGRGGVGRAALILTLVQRIKKRARKEVRQMQTEQRDLENQAHDAEREAEKQKDREREKERRRQDRERRNRSQERDHEHDRSL